MKKEKNIYLKNEDLAAELLAWYESGDCPENRVISDRLAIMLQTIAEHLIKSPKFNRYDYDHKRDMIGDAVLKMIKNLKNYKPERSASAFNYFTRCAYCSFLANLSKHYKYINSKNRYYDEVYAIYGETGPTIDYKI